jgi:hypothetical protein
MTMNFPSSTLLLFFRLCLYRFSRQPIRMTGRVVSTLKGEVQGSSRFVMVKKRDKNKDKTEVESKN